MYKEASKKGTRFQTSRGNLNVEQLWNLTLDELDNLAVSLQNAYENSKSKSFLDKRTTKDKDLKLQFDIVLDILQSKVEQNESLKEAKEIKEHNQEIMSLIQEKQKGALKEKSVSELKRMLK